MTNETVDNNNQIQEVLERIEAEGIEFIRVEFLDYTGITRGRTIRKSNIKSAMEKGINFSKAIVSFNMFDEMIPNGAYGTSDGDFFAVPDPTTFSVVPYRKNTARMFCDLYDIEGQPWQGCPRNKLKSLIKEVEEVLGGKVNLAYEQEAYLLEEVNSKLEPADYSQCFSTEGLDIQEEFMQDFVHSLEAMGVKTDQISSEYGPGQLEVNLTYADALKATDDQVTFKQLFKEVARIHGKVGTLMAKPFLDYPGSGLHVHISIYNEDGVNLFKDLDDTRDLDLSQEAYYFIGGLLKHSKSLVAIGAPTFNSYKRMQPGSWAPAHICYGDGNRSALVRVLEKIRERRFEFRGADGSCNPYLFSSSLLAAGLDGVKNKIDPGDPVRDDVSDLNEVELHSKGIEWVPRTLPEALANLENNKVLEEVLGGSIINEFINVKRDEADKYNKYISNWELENTAQVF